MDRLCPDRHGDRGPVSLPAACIRRGWLRALLFALAWWILTNGASASWPVGVPVVLIATAASVLLLPPLAFSLQGAACFVPFFLWHSLRGAMDVALRVFHPRLPIVPGLLRHRWRLPAGLPRVFMANTVSLLPGTLSAETDSEYLYIHTLDLEGDPLSELMTVETRVAALFGICLTDDGSRQANKRS